MTRGFRAVTGYPLPLVARLAKACSVFFLGIFGMAATFDIANSTPWLLWSMRGFIDAPFELFVPLFLTGYILLGAFGVSIAWRKWRVALIFLTGFLLNFWWTFFSHTLTQPGNLFWFPDLSGSWFAKWSSGTTEDLQAFYSFLAAVGAYFVSRALSTRSVVRPIAQSLLFGSGALVVYTGLLSVMAPAWGTDHVTNFEEGLCGMDFAFVSHEVLFFASCVVAAISGLYLYCPGRRQRSMRPEPIHQGGTGDPRSPAEACPPRPASSGTNPPLPRKDYDPGRRLTEVGAYMLVVGGVAVDCKWLASRRFTKIV